MEGIGGDTEIFKVGKPGCNITYVVQAGIIYVSVKISCVIIPDNIAVCPLEILG